MIFSFLQPDNLGEKYQAAKDYTATLTDPFPEYERIARNRPKPNIPSEYPKTTDGTTASIIRKTGKRVVQQLPTGKIEADNDNDWIPIVAEFIYSTQILPYANEEYDLVQKCWNMIERGLTFGSSAIYTPFVNHGGHFTTDMTLPYWGDIFIQPGKKSGYSCDYVFIRSWWQVEDIEATIDREKKLAKSAKERGEEYEGTWDLKALESIKDKITKKDEDAKTPGEEELNVNPEGIEVVTGFQVGVDAKFYTFHPTTGKDKEDDVTVLRTKTNKDPRGKMPIDWFYADIDGANPLGRGIVDLLKGLQNLIDSDMQMYQFNRALMLAPPIVKKGSFSKSKIVYKPHAVIDLGSDPNAMIETLKVDSSAVINYPDLYGLQKSQLLNLVSSPDTSISAEVGNPGFGKTPSAIDAQQSMISVDDNYLRKMFEACFENWSETAVNLYFAERSGVEELQLDKRTADKLRKLADEGKFDPSMLSEDDKIMIDYDSATPLLKFRVDASTSKMKDDASQGEILTQLIQAAEKSPILAQVIPPEKFAAAWNKIVSNSGVEDPEDLSIDIEEMMQQMQQQQMAEQQMMEQQALAEGAPIEGEVVEEELPPEMIEAAMQEEMMAEQDPFMQIAEMLAEAGVPEELIVDGVDMARRGASPEEVFAAIEEVMSDGGV